MSRRPTPALLLAAGGSTRLGHPKQLVKIGDRTLLRRAAEETLAAGCGPLTVVLGARADELEQELAGLDLLVCRNSRWKEGMASSLRSGLRSFLDRDPSLPRVMILLCDQPAVDRAILTRLVELHAGGRTSATACAVEGRAGPPAIFESSHFEELLALRGNHGAREILRDPATPVTLLEFPAGAIDVDRPEDLG